MTDDATPSNVTHHSTGAAQSLAEVLLRSQFKIASGLTEALRSQFQIPSFASQFKIASFVGVLQQADRLKEAGWIPHPALPVKELVASKTDTTQLSDCVQLYVDNNREQIYEVMSNRFSTYTISKDTLKLCNAAIQAHRLELFPLIVPSVFAEIELCARAVLGFSTQQYGKKIIDNFVSRVNDLPISAFDIVQIHTLVLMDDFIYKSITPNSQVSLPHRHGSQHGIIRFNTGRDCLNAIFLLDFVLQSCDAIQNS
jgi:hypothetical protein